MSRVRIVILVWLLSSLLAVLPLSAQDQKPTPPKPPPIVAAEEAKKPERGFFNLLVHNVGDDFKHMVRLNTVYWLAGGGGLALVVHQEDDEINAHFKGSDFADSFFKPGKYIGSTPLVLGAAVTTYIVGRAGNKPRAQHIGMDLIEASLVSEGVTQAIKYTVRRERPIAPDGSQYSGYSFPSGHATITFAAATVLQQHLGWKMGVPAYLVATYVAMSRLHDDKHFASDVIFGATNGIIIGRSVTWHVRNYAMMPMVVPGGAGVMVSLKH